MSLRVQPFETGPFGCLPAAAAQDRLRLRSVPPPGERTEKSRSPGGAIETVEMASRRACPYAYSLSSSTSENSASTTSSLALLSPAFASGVAASSDEGRGGKEGGWP